MGTGSNGENELSKRRWRRAAGWVAAIFFIAIGFIFANALSLMDHVDRWEEIWSKHNVAGAALGTGLNVGDPTLWPRWLLMFGLALGTNGGLDAGRYRIFLIATLPKTTSVGHGNLPKYFIPWA